MLVSISGYKVLYPCADKLDAMLVYISEYKVLYPSLALVHKLCGALEVGGSRCTVTS